MLPPLLHILYIEDEPDIREVAKLVLEMLGGYKVHLCASGSEALHYLSDHVPDLILLDVMMPDMDGPGTALAIGQLPQARHVPIIFMTAKLPSHARDEAQISACIGIIPKPFNAVTLTEQIQALWNRHYEQ